MNCRWILIVLIFLCICNVAYGVDLEHDTNYAIVESYTREYVLCLFPNGTVKGAGDNSHGQCCVEQWNDIVKVAVGYGHSVGLTKCGTVVATGKNDYGQCDVEQWSDIIDIAADVDYTVGLKSNGTVVCCGYLPEQLKRVIAQWDGIQSIYASWDIHGLTEEGNVVSTLLLQEVVPKGPVRQVISRIDTLYILEWDGNVMCISEQEDFSNYIQSYDVVQLADDNGLLQLLSDGTIRTSRYGSEQCEWKDIVMLTSSYGIKSDGTIVSVHNDTAIIDVCLWRLW